MFRAAYPKGRRAPKSSPVNFLRNREYPLSGLKADVAELFGNSKALFSEDHWPSGPSSHGLGDGCSHNRMVRTSAITSYDAILRLDFT